MAAANINLEEVTALRLQNCFLFLSFVMRSLDMRRKLVLLTNEAKTYVVQKFLRKRLLWPPYLICKRVYRLNVSKYKLL